jgi:hypothetical protein
MGLTAIGEMVLKPQIEAVEGLVRGYVFYFFGEGILGGLGFVHLVLFCFVLFFSFYLV